MRLARGAGLTWAFSSSSRANLRSWRSFGRRNFLSRPPDELKQPVIFWKGIGDDAALRADFEGAGFGFGTGAAAQGLVMMLVAGTPRTVSPAR